MNSSLNSSNLTFPIFETSQTIFTSSYTSTNGNNNPQTETGIFPSNIEDAWLYWMILVAIMFIICCIFCIFDIINTKNDISSPELYDMDSEQRKIKIEEEKIVKVYEEKLQKPCFYYILKCLFYLSSLAEDLLVYFYTDYDIHGEATPFYVFWALSVCMVCLCNIYGCYTIALELTQAILFMFFCNWSLLSIIIFPSIFIFQFLCHIILSKWNGDNFWHCGHDPEDDDKSREQLMYEAEKEGERYGESCQQVLLGNLELVAFLYYSEDSPFRSLWYELLLIWVFWVASFAFDIKTYMFYYGNIYLPTRNIVHCLMDGCLRIVIVSVWGIKYLTIGLCIYYLITTEEMSKFEYGFSIFIIAFWGCCLGVTLPIMCIVPIFRDVVGCGGCGLFCKWFFCCK